MAWEVLVTDEDIRTGVGISCLDRLCWKGGFLRSVLGWE